MITDQTVRFVEPKDIDEDVDDVTGFARSS